MLAGNRNTGHSYSLFYLSHITVTPTANFHPDFVSEVYSGGKLWYTKLDLIPSWAAVCCAVPKWIYARMECSSGCARPLRLNSVSPHRAQAGRMGLRRVLQTSHQRRRKTDLPRRGRAVGGGFFVWLLCRPHRTGRDIWRLLTIKQCYDATIRKEVTKILWLKN